MNLYIVLYRVEAVMKALDQPFGFNCMAEGVDHAEEQCLNAYPDCDIVWVYEAETGDTDIYAAYKQALRDYWLFGEE